MINSTTQQNLGATNEPAQTTNGNTTQAQTPATTQKVTSSVTTTPSTTVPSTGPIIKLIKSTSHKN